MQPAPYPPAYPGQGLSTSMQQPFPQGYPGQQQPLNSQQQQFGMQPSQAATAASQSYPQGQFQAPQQMSMQASMQAAPGAFHAGQAPGAMQPQQYPGNQGQPGMQGTQGPGVGQSAAFPGSMQQSQQLAMSQQGPPLGASHDPMHALSAQGSVPNSAQLPQMMMGPGGQMVPAGPGSVMGSQPGVAPGMGMGMQAPAPVYDPVTGQMIMPQGQLPMAGPVQYDAQGRPIHMPLKPGPFKTTLYSCTSHCAVCLMGWCVPCCLYGDNRARVYGDGFWTHCLLYGFCPLLTWIFAADLRRTIRNKYRLHEEPCSDCCVHCWCSPCAICQEARELNLRG